MKKIVYWTVKNKYYFLLAGIVFLVYFNSLFNDFVWDDKYLVVNNEYIKDIRHVFDIFNPRFEIYKLPLYQGVYRPVRILTFMIDYQLWGLNPFGFHLTNVILHILCTLLLFYFFKNILKLNAIYAFFAALFFGIHPLNTETVTWIKNRHNIIEVILALWMIIVYRRGRIWLMSIIVIFGTMTKESFISNTVFLLLIEVYELLKDRGNVKVKEILINQKIKRSLKAIFLSVVLVAIIFVFKKIVMGYGIFPGISIRRDPADIFGIYTLKGVAFKERIATVVKIMVFYLRLFLLPLKLNADYQISVTSNLNFLYLLIVFFVVYMGIILFKRKKLVGLAILWTIISLFPYSNLFISLSRMMAEHYLYSALIGVAIIFAEMVEVIFKRKKIILFHLLLGYFIFLGLRTVSRNFDWKDNLTLWKSSLEVNKSARAYLNLGQIYFEKGLLELAYECVQKARELIPNYSGIYEILGKLCVSKGFDKEAIKYYLKAVEYAKQDGEKSNYYNLIGVSYSNLKDYENAEKYYKRGLEADTSNAAILLNLAALYKDLGDINESLEYRKRAYALDREVVPPFTQIGIEAHMNNQIETALYFYKKAIKEGEKSFTLFFNLGYIYMTKNEIDSALKYFKLCEQINPRNVRVLNNIGLLYERGGDIRRAVFYYKKGLEIANEFLPCLYNLARVYYKIGDRHKALKYFIRYNKINNKDPMVNYYLGTIYLHFGKLKRAKFYFNQVLKFKNVNKSLIEKTKKILGYIKTQGG